MIQRYTPRGGSKVADMWTYKGGAWVKYEDHAAAVRKLQERLTRLRKVEQGAATEIEETRFIADDLRDKLKEMTAERDALQGQLESAKADGMEAAAAICDARAEAYLDQSKREGMSQRDRDHQNALAFAAEMCADIIREKKDKA